MGGWYSASKHALSAAIHRRHMGVELRVVLIEPGAVATPFWDRVRADLSARETSAHPALHARSTALLTQVQQGRNGPAPVARTVVRAVEAARPRRRCTVGIDARLGMLC